MYQQWIGPLAPLIGLRDRKPSEPLRADELATPFDPPRRRRSTRARIAGWLSGLGGFYALSSAFHLLSVGVIATAPMQFTPHVQAQARKARTKVSNEIVVLQGPCFDLVAPPSPDHIDKYHEIVAALKAQRVLLEEADDAAKAAAEKHSADADLAAARESIRRSRAAAENYADKLPAANTSIALAAALAWLVRHQEPGGGWSLDGFERQCQGAACGAAGKIDSPAAATGLALLPLLTSVAAGAAEASDYEPAIAGGAQWLVERQLADGDLSAGGAQRMYSHAVAAIALAKRFAATKDAKIGAAAQRAVDFSLAAQNPNTGGWHYEPGGSGNTSSVAWQLLLIEVASQSGLTIDPECCRKADAWFRSVEQGRPSGRFSYEPGRPVTTTMTAVGLRYLALRGVPPTHAAFRGGRDYLREHPPNPAFTRDIFYWYWATPVVRSGDAEEWKAWLTGLTKGLLETQAAAGCSAGSWSAGSPAAEIWSTTGGRLCVTSLAAQLLLANPGEGPALAPPTERPLAARQDGSTTR